MMICTNYLYLTAWTSKLVEVSDDMHQLLVLDCMDFKVNDDLYQLLSLDCTDFKVSRN